MNRADVCKTFHASLRRATAMALATMMCTPLYAEPGEAEGQNPPQVDDIATTGEEVVFAGNDKTAWRLFLGSMNNWSVPIQGPVTTSYRSNAISVRTIDNLGKADAYQAQWQGGLAQVYWQREQALDLNAMEAAGGALSMVIRVDQKPKKKVEFKMDCGYPCAGTLKMTKLLNAVPLDQWFRISLKLSCFEESGANLGHILAPMVVATEDEFAMSFADIRILENPPPESLVPCN